MTGVKHAFTSGKADDADATLVNPSDWNAEHEPNLTTKGDIIARGASASARLGVGSNGEVLTAASGEATGLKYAVCPTLDLAAVAGDILQATGANALAILSIGAAREILAVNSGATALEYVKRKRTYVWFIKDTLATGTEQGPTFRIDEACTILDVRLHVKSAPSGVAIIVDINDGGSTVFSTRPEIDASGTVEDDNHVFSDTALADDTELTMDIDQIGGASAGADLTVEIEVSVP